MICLDGYPRILECTLRDGSYAVDFQFTRRDTQAIVTALEGAGFDLIEVGHGHGVGLGFGFAYHWHLAVCRRAPD